MPIRSTATALTQLLSLKLWGSFPLAEIAPWRKELRIKFIGLRVRDAFNLQREVGEFRDAFPRPGSVFAVLRCPASRL